MNDDTNKNPRLQGLLQRCAESARARFGKTAPIDVVVSPYRFNPLGAHVDHQGGSVLARTIDQYTLLPFLANENSDRITLSANPGWAVSEASFTAGDLDATENWIRYAQASARALKEQLPSHSQGIGGYQGQVEGTLVGAGLSSSASVVLAYLMAMAHSAGLSLTRKDLVELSRQVENNYLGLNNGIQDQMSIVFGQTDALSLLDMNKVAASAVPDAATVNEICWIICYSGFSRELINSGFNTRVAECREAAKSLGALQRTDATILGDLKRHQALEQLSKIEPLLQLRALHFFSETERVEQGCRAWSTGSWVDFGQLMNASCHSSITQYESGSQALIDLHEIASATSGVYGSRFGGGGYGGCLIALTDRRVASDAQSSILESYRKRYPEKDNAHIFIANSESCVRLETV
ncbi:MAG: hypothetical protein KTR32_37650 [Granulosicoccus sp.]|nr:hypothetical protein [Granulosicoccus sp.]